MFWGGSLQRRRWLDLIGWIVWIVSVSVFLVLLVETDFLCAGWYNGKNWLATVWMVQTDWMGQGWDRGVMEGLMLAGAETGAPPLALEGQQEAGSGVWNHLSRRYKGSD